MLAKRASNQVALAYEWLVGLFTSIYSVHDTWKITGENMNSAVRVLDSEMFMSITMIE